MARQAYREPVVLPRRQNLSMHLAKVVLHREPARPKDYYLEVLVFAQAVLARRDFELVDPSDLHQLQAGRLCPESVYPSGFALHPEEVVVAFAEPVPRLVSLPNLLVLPVRSIPGRQNLA